MKKTYLKLAAVVAISFFAFFVVFPKVLISAGEKLSKVKQLSKVADSFKETGAYFDTNYPFKLGLDLQGGSHLVYEVKTEGVEAEDRPRAVESLRTVIRNRIDQFGVAEPTIYTTKRSGKDFLVVELPGVKDLSKAVELIGKTAKLEFRVEKQSKKTAEPGLPEYASYDPPFTGEYLKRATVASDPTSGLPQVALEFNDEGAKIFAKMTKEYIGKSIAIYLDEIQISAPTVQAEIVDGRAVITGVGTIEEAKKLSIELNAGALPLPIELVENRTVGASLGQDSITRSVVAGVLGLLAIGLFMIIYYRLPGLLATLALGVYSLVTLALFKGVLSFILPFTPVTITLAGIAGFILSVGMAVDANILIFERIKEELREGKIFSQAIDHGFKRAWSSIKDSNVSSLITSFILFSFGTGLIRGFAVTLALGILVSMFSAITVTKTFLIIVSSFKWGRTPFLYGVKKVGGNE